MGEWVVHFDGLYEPRHTDRGIATYGFRVTHEGDVLAEEHGLVAGPGGPLASAHVAEYGALIQALAWVRDHKHDDCPLVVRGDSRLVIETVAGRWNLTSPHLVPLRDAARELARDARVRALQKVSREDNAEADRLSRLAYRAQAAAHPEWGLGVGAARARR